MTSQTSIPPEYKSTYANNEQVVKELLSPRETAKYLNMGLSTVAKMRLRGNGPIYMKIGAKVIYRKTDLNAWLASKRRASTSQEEKHVINT
jgi:excisionase family DNA binding protein